MGRKTKRKCLFGLHHKEKVNGEEKRALLHEDRWRKRGGDTTCTPGKKKKAQREGGKADVAVVL